MSGAPGGRPKILVIDDNPTIIDVIRYTIKMHGAYEAIIAQDGVEGLEKFYTEHPICVIIDAKMPRMDGFQLLRCLRGDDESAGTALIMLTALVREDDQITGLLSGADEYLTKPFKPRILMDTIERVLRVTPAERQARIDGLITAMQGL